MRYFLPIFLFVASLFVSCGPEQKPKSMDSTQGDSSGRISDTMPSPAIAGQSLMPVFIRIGENGLPVDTFSEWTNALHAKSEVGKPVSFPGGLAALQAEKPDTVIVVCDQAVMPWPVFRPSSGPSLFTKKNTEKNFFFLTEIDSNRLHVDDCNYALLRFLRYKTVAEKLQAKKTAGSAEFVNKVKSNTIRWSRPLHAQLIEDHRRMDISFTDWVEYWECGEKHDYAPPYPSLQLPRGEIIKPFPYPKNYDVEYMGGLLEHRYTNPLFIFSYLRLSDAAGSVLDSVPPAASREASLITTDGKTVKGNGIDLDNDKLIDAFWFHEYLNGGGSDKAYPGWNIRMSWVVRLYLKIDGEWVPVWYRHCDFHT